MSVPYIGEIRMYGFGFAPRDWAKCDGALLLVNQNPELNSLLKNTFGGDGTTNFALPDLRGRAPVHIGSDPTGRTITQGQKGGAETVAITTETMAGHIHALAVSSTLADEIQPKNQVLAKPTERDLYGSATNLVAMNPAAVAATGGGQAHDNMQPSSVINFCIALQGLYPTPN